MRVQYEDNGVIQIREVPAGSKPEAYKYGVLIGPPDLSDLSLPVKKIKELNKAFALEGFGNYKDTQGRRGVMLELIKRVTGKPDKELLRHILYIYQKNYLEDGV